MSFKTYLLEKKQQSGLGAEDTKIVECAQCVYLAMVSNNIKPVFENFKKASKYYNIDTTLDKIENLPQEWIQSSIYGAKFLNKKFPLMGKVFHRGSNLVDLIENKFKELNKIAGKPFSNINKFTPADIWISDKNINLNDIKKCKSLEELREQLKRMFNEGILIGISLKKITSENPPFKIYNDKPPKTIHYTGNIIYKNLKLFKDSMDVYILFKSQKEGKIQFRSFSGRASSWQGEVKGISSNAGKIGGGIVMGFSKKHLSKQITTPVKVTKMVKKMDKNFLDKFFFYATESGYNITKKEFNDYLLSTNKDNNLEKYLYSKYLGMELLYIMKNSTDAQNNKFITDLINYASSSTSESAIFVKLGE